MLKKRRTEILEAAGTKEIYTAFTGCYKTRYQRNTEIKDKLNVSSIIRELKTTRRIGYSTYIYWSRKGKHYTKSDKGMYNTGEKRSSKPEENMVRPT
jgi:hypothetical protein